MQDLGCLFDPASVALTGVSPGNAGERYTDYLLKYGFKGVIFPLRPKCGKTTWHCIRKKTDPERSELR